MKKAIAYLLYLLAPAMVNSAQASILIGITPATQDIVVGAPVAVAITITGLGEHTAPSVSTFDLDVRFDPLILKPDPGQVMFGDPSLGDQLDLSGLGSVNAITSIGNDTVNLFELSFDTTALLNASQAGSFTLVMLRFGALSIGGSNIHIILNALGDAAGNPLPADIADGNVTVIPNPPILLLFGSGLISMSWRRYRPKARR